MDAFGELIDGCEMDVTGTTLRRPSTTSSATAGCVAGSVGRLSLGVFGTRPTRAGRAAYADALGVALQLTNILRDVREDRAWAACTCPQDDARPVRLRPRIDVGRLADPDGSLAALIRFEADAGPGLVRRRACSCSRCSTGAAAPASAAMAGIYRRLLDRIAADPRAVLDGRLSLPRAEKARGRGPGPVGLGPRRPGR